MMLDLRVRITVRVCLMPYIAFALRLGRSSVMIVVMTRQAGCQTHRHRAGHHRVGAHQLQRPSES